ncbi:hypothetical protein B0187_03240 [Haemophilus paracuniculus]|uniref:tRNA-modifying protein YgfZ-like beta-barrel domain-containing protein n=1 Tax=Haemophilus paracuniculus TaxID=734 RepID=A0A1T0AU06_9PAST|nr:hypothetical protein [Haemophilus paracuniculus]OOR99835.1 hypothetical protein B0187_03240 [Haemophilus paracuniculus]
MTTENLCVALSQYKLIEIAGADAEKYLQGQLTCDVSKLSEQQHTLTAHCDPKGKMSALFRLYRHSAEQFFAIIRQDLLPEALTQLKKYAVFSKVSFSELAQPIFGTTSGQIAENFKDQATILTLAGTPTRYLFWGDIQPETNGEPSQWDLLEIQQGEPILLKANQFELIPQAVNLQMLEQAISFTKGCYIGQETVARAKYRGANKRAMFTLVGDCSTQPNLPEIGGAVELQLGENWKQTGTILQAIHAENRLWLQVVLNKETETTAKFRVNGVDLVVYPLPYALEP